MSEEERCAVSNCKKILGKSYRLFEGKKYCLDCSNEVVEMFRNARIKEGMNNADMQEM